MREANELNGLIHTSTCCYDRILMKLISYFSTKCLFWFLFEYNTVVYLFQVQQSLDGVMEYLLHNIPLNWLVGPFAPQVTEKAEEDVAMEQTGSNS